jgi:hypothetical protein
MRGGEGTLACREERRLGNHHVINSEDLIIGLHDIPCDACWVHLEENVIRAR